MKKCLLVLLTLVLLLGTCAAVAESLNVPYDLISEVWIYEPRVTAIALEYDKPLACAFDLTGSFAVNAELKELVSHENLPIIDSSWPMSPRKITAAYTSDEPKVGKICAGNYVIIELSDTDSNAASTYISLKRSFQDLDKSKGWNNGREILPYGENMIYEIEQLYNIKYADGTYTGTDVTFERRNEWTLIADDFVPGVYVSDTTTVDLQVNNETKSINSIDYTLYSPANPVEGEKYPLVLYLHGSSCRSIYEDEIDDVMTPVLTNQGAITWVKHGTEDCYVFVPQYEFDTVPLVKEAFAALLADESLAIDMDRVYISGLSMGGMTSLSFLMDDRFCDTFAAALINCGAPRDDVDGATVAAEFPAKLARVMENGTQVWLVHSDTDPTVPVAGSYQAFKGMLGLALDGEMPAPISDDKDFTVYEALDGQLRFTEVHFIVGQRNTNFNMYSVSPHEVYEYSYSEPMFIEWLFNQSK